MPILVVCQSCKTRFQVNEKFAGKQGPCPKCKALITIPKAEEQVVIHAPDEYTGGASSGPKDAKGRAVLKPISREKSNIQPVVIVGGVAFALVTLIVAWLLRGSEPNIWILASGAFLLAPPIVLAGYAILRDDEIEPYRGLPLALRVTIVSIVYAALWGVAALFRVYVYEATGPEIWQMGPPIGIMIVAGVITAVATLDLEPLPAFFHYAFYLAATVALRVIMDLWPI